MSSQNYNTIQNSDCENGSTEDDSLLERSQRKVRHFWDGFVDFAFQGNILQIAFGLMCVLFFLYVCVNMAGSCRAQFISSNANTEGVFSTR